MLHVDSDPEISESLERLSPELQQRLEISLRDALTTHLGADDLEKDLLKDFMSKIIEKLFTHYGQDGLEAALESAMKKIDADSSKIQKIADGMGVDLSRFAIEMIEEGEDLSVSSLSLEDATRYLEDLPEDLQTMFEEMLDIYMLYTTEGSYVSIPGMRDSTRSEVLLQIASEAEERLKSEGRSLHDISRQDILDAFGTQLRSFAKTMLEDSNREKLRNELVRAGEGIAFSLSITASILTSRFEPIRSNPEGLQQELMDLKEGDVIVSDSGTVRLVMKISERSDLAGLPLPDHIKAQFSTLSVIGFREGNKVLLPSRSKSGDLTMKQLIDSKAIVRQYRAPEGVDQKKLVEEYLGLQ